MEYNYLVYSIGVDQKEYTDEIHSSAPLDKLIYNSIVFPPTDRFPERTVYDIELI